MEKFMKYLLLQGKRMIRAFPAIFAATFALMAGLCIVVMLLFHVEKSDDSKQKVQIGVVGDVTGTYLEWGLYALENMDDSRYTVDFYTMTEEDARKKLERGELTAYIRIPEGFVESVMVAENKTVTYVTTSGAVNIGSLLMQELVDVVSNLLVESQNGIYGMQEIAKQYNIENDRFWDATIDMNKRYIDYILQRGNLYNIEEIGVSNQLSTTGYYVCGIVLFLFLVWGINGSTLLIKKDFALSKMLAAKGQGVTSQVLGEYLAYIGLMVVSLISMVALLLFGLNKFGVDIPEWTDNYESCVPVFLGGLILVLIMIGAMQFFMYELTSGFVSGVLLQFLSAIVLGYLSGCLYPIGFFPHNIQRLANVLPTGIALQYLNHIMLGETFIAERIELLLYSIVFLVLAILVRRRRMVKEE